MGAHVEWVTFCSACVIATLEGLPTGCSAGEGCSDAAVLEEGDVVAVAGHGQHLLAGRARRRGRLCLPHLLSHLNRPLHILMFKYPFLGIWSALSCAIASATHLLSGIWLTCVYGGTGPCAQMAGKLKSCYRCMGNCLTHTHLYSWWRRGRCSLPGFDQLDARRHCRRWPCEVWHRRRLWMMTFCRTCMPTVLRNSSIWFLEGLHRQAIGRCPKGVLNCTSSQDKNAEIAIQ